MSMKFFTNQECPNWDLITISHNISQQFQNHNILTLLNIQVTLFPNLYTCNSFQAKSEVIAIYALCGFANFSSIGIQLGGLGPLAPKRKGDLAQVVLRALLGGVMACLLTASIAGM